MRRNIHFSLLVFVAVSALAMGAGDPLEYQWNVQVTPESSGNGFNDVLTFKQGLFTSQWFEKKGFKPGQYDEDTRKFGPATFTVTLSSDANGAVKWTGTVAATSITGDMVWTKKDGTVVNYSYSGQRSDQ
jgi:hypothetical protein